MKFSHAGSMGDAVYSALFMRELSEASEQPIEEVHLQYGKAGYYSQPHPYGDQQLTKGAAEFLAPLFEAQGWKTSMSDEAPEDFIDLDTFRMLRINFSSFDIRLWYYSLVKQFLPMDLKRRTISVERDYTFKDKIILAKTSRYNNHFIDYKALEPLKDKIVMIGLEEEWKAFSKDYFKVSFYRVKDALDAAKKISGCKMFLANQCGLYSIAEMMKTPRALFTAEFIDIVHPQLGQQITVPGPCNVVPQGGVCFSIATQQKLKGLVEQL